MIPQSLNLSFVRGDQPLKIDNYHVELVQQDIPVSSHIQNDGLILNLTTLAGQQTYFIIVNDIIEVSIDVEVEALEVNCCSVYRYRVFKASPFDYVYKKSSEEMIIMLPD